MRVASVTKGSNGSEVAKARERLSSRLPHMHYLASTCKVGNSKVLRLVAFTEVDTHSGTLEPAGGKS